MKISNIKKSSRKITNLSIGVFIYIMALFIGLSSVYLFIVKEKKQDNNKVNISKSYKECLNSGKIRNFIAEEKSDREILFYSANLRNNFYSTITSMTLTVNACEGFKLKRDGETCIGPGCEQKGVGIPFYFTLEQEVR